MLMCIWTYFSWRFKCSQSIYKFLKIISSKGWTSSVQMKLAQVQKQFIDIVVINKRQTLTCTKPLKFIINVLNFFVIILIIPFCYIVLPYLFYQLLNFLNSIDVLWNICSSMHDNYIRFLTKFWFNIIAYINNCSTGMRSHLYSVFSWYSYTSYIFSHEIPSGKNNVWFFPCILLSLFFDSFDNTVLSFNERFFFCFFFVADGLIFCDIPCQLLYFQFSLLCRWNNGQFVWISFPLLKIYFVLYDVICDFRFQ